MCVYGSQSSVEIVRYTFVQASQLCTRTRAKKVVVGLTLVAIPVGCSTHLSHYLYRYSITYYIFDQVFLIAFFVVLPVIVLIINVLLVREVRRASIDAAANLGLHHQSTSSNSAVPTVMVVATSLVYVLLRGSESITSLISVHYGSLFYNSYVPMIIFVMSRFVFAYNFYVYLITGKQFRSELLTLFCRCSSCSSCSCSSSCSSSSSSPAAAARGYNDARLTERGQAETAV